jgi:DNA-binding winged helix-turn-helix (wHTH) protein
MRRIRLKIEPDAEHPRWIKTIRSVGYRFEPQPWPEDVEVDVDIGEASSARGNAR